MKVVGLALRKVVVGHRPMEPRSERSAIEDRAHVALAQSFPAVAQAEGARDEVSHHGQAKARTGRGNLRSKERQQTHAGSPVSAVGSATLDQGVQVSKRLVEAMGGSIGVESIPGRGSTFFVELPASSNPALTTGFPVELGSDPLVVSGPTVLYIEDNPSNYALVEQVLEMQRPAVRLLGAMLGQLGLDMAREHRPELILLDLQLPDLSGEVVLRHLRADESTSGIPVIMVSADATAENPQRLMDSGALGYLTKPLKIIEFVQAIDDALATAS